MCLMPEVHPIPEAAAVEAVEEFRGFKIADLRRVFARAVFIAGVEHPKEPFAIAADVRTAMALCAAVAFFNADEPTVSGPMPITGKVIVETRGYQAW